MIGFFFNPNSIIVAVVVIILILFSAIASNSDIASFGLLTWMNQIHPGAYIIPTVTRPPRASAHIRSQAEKQEKSPGKRLFQPKKSFQGRALHRNEGPYVKK